MSNSYQRASQRRKLVYFGSIVGLFVLTIFVRGVVAMPIEKDRVGKWTIQSQSKQLELIESSQGDVELTGSAVRLLLTGSRGLAVCGLWMSANEKQKRHEWNEMELVVKSVTKLQPHFVTPWLFQSWNLTYNVSVEMDRLNDMYFYISRGINLLAEGETVNKNNPDIRYAIASYYQNKFTVSDKVTTLRSLFHLSCLPRDERDYRTLMKGGQVNEEAFQAFCEKNPQFVRRLRETAIRYGKGSNGEDQKPDFLVSRPIDVVMFLKDNEVLPSRFRDDDPRMLEDRLRQFPVVPSPFYPSAEEEMNPDRPTNDGKASAVRAARVWYRYANEVIPAPNPEPSFSSKNYRDPERKRRMPARPTLIIFRQGPQRAQSYIAEQLAKDGWLDGDPWVVDEHRQGPDRWFKEEVKIKPTANSQEEWELAHRMWLDHGRENGLIIEPARLIDYRRRAEIYARKRGFQMETGNILPPHTGDLEDKVIADSIKANYVLQAYNAHLRDTNFKFFLYQADFEKAPETIKARKLLYEAEQARKSNQVSEAIALYDQVLGTQQNRGLWAELIYKRNYRTLSDRFAEKIAEETYEQEINYLRLIRYDKNKQLRRSSLLLFDLMRLSSPAVQASPLYFAMNDLLMQEKAPALQRVEPIWPPGPFDGLDPEGHPWIPDYVVDRVRQNQGLNRPAAKPKGDATAQK